MENGVVIHLHWNTYRLTGRNPEVSVLLLTGIGVSVRISFIEVCFRPVFSKTFEPSTPSALPSSLMAGTSRHPHRHPCQAKIAGVAWCWQPLSSIRMHFETQKTLYLSSKYIYRAWRWPDSCCAPHTHSHYLPQTSAIFYHTLQMQKVRQWPGCHPSRAHCNSMWVKWRHAYAFTIYNLLCQSKCRRKISRAKTPNLQ